MLKDREFLAEIEKSGQEFYPASGEQVQKLIAATANAPRSVVELTEATLYTKPWHQITLAPNDHAARRNPGR